MFIFMYICACTVQTQKFGSPLSGKGKILYLFSEYKSLNKKKILEERKIPVENTLCAKTC